MRTLHLIAAAFLFTAGVSDACQIPVFRYALERWIPDDYRLGSKVEPASEFANLTHTPSSDGTLTLRYPATVPVKSPIFTAPDSQAALASIATSPARQEILRRILSGDSAVWVLVESGDSQKDTAAFDILESSLRNAESVLTLPEGIIGTEEARRRDVTPEEEENVLVSNIPLQIKFSTFRLSRDNPNEAVLLALLLHMEPDLGEFADEPITFPIFGRARVLNPLVAGGITSDNILTDCSYLCGACSCQVKRENPGIDALVSADWDAALEGNSAIPEKTLPPLTGAGDVVSPNTPTNQDTPTPVAPPVANTPPSTFPNTYLFAIGAALLLITVITLRILKRP